MDNRSFHERFLDAKCQPSPLQVFLNEVAKVTYRNPQTIKKWATGEIEPDGAMKTLRAMHFNTSVDVLFPIQSVNG